MIEDAIGAGIRRYYFGRELDEYKHRWSKERHGLNDMIMARTIDESFYCESAACRQACRSKARSAAVSFDATSVTGTLMKAAS